MPKAILIEDDFIYTWQGKQVKRDLLKRDGSGMVAFVDVGNGTLYKIPAQEELESHTFPIDSPLDEPVEVSKQCEVTIDEEKPVKDIIPDGYLDRKDINELGRKGSHFHYLELPDPKTTEN